MQTIGSKKIRRVLGLITSAFVGGASVYGCMLTRNAPTVELVIESRFGSFDLPPVVDFVKHDLAGNQKKLDYDLGSDESALGIVLTRDNVYDRISSTKSLLLLTIRNDGTKMAEDTNLKLNAKGFASVESDREKRDFVRQFNGNMELGRIPVHGFVAVTMWLKQPPDELREATIVHKEGSLQLSLGQSALHPFAFSNLVVACLCIIAVGGVGFVLGRWPHFKRGLGRNRRSASKAPAKVHAAELNTSEGVTPANRQT